MCWERSIWRRDQKYSGDLVGYIDSRRVSAKVILFGEIDREIKSSAFEVTGRYDFQGLESMIREKDIDVFLLPSIWP